LAEKRVIKIPEIPEGSRFEKYLNKLDEIMKGAEPKILPYLYGIFVDCWDYMKQNPNIQYLPQITLKLVPTHGEFKKVEQEEGKKAVSKEDAKYESTAFVVGNRFAARIYVDLQKFIDLSSHFGGPTFVLNIVETYVHEILHIAFPEEYEQEIHDMQCSLLDEFLGIRLQHETRNVKVSDYYSKKAKKPK